MQTELAALVGLSALFDFSLSCNVSIVQHLLVGRRVYTSKHRRCDVTALVRKIPETFAMLLSTTDN